MAKDDIITQSEAWQRLQDALGEESFYRTGKDWHFLAINKHTPVGNYLYLPYGPVAEDQESFADALDSLTGLAREHHAFFLRIEPRHPAAAELLKSRSIVQAHGATLYVHKSKDSSPADTWQLSLTPDQDTLVKGFSQGTRRGYHGYAKQGITAEPSQDPADLQYLTALQAQLFHSKHLHAYSASYLATELAQPFATLYLVKFHRASATTLKEPVPPDNHVLAAGLYFDYHRTRYYMQGASDPTYKKHPAAVAMQTTAIFDAKAHGFTTFDFWGIAPDGAPSTHPWAGFTQFKKSFGGTPAHYAGTYDLALRPARYRLYQSLRRLRP